MGTNVTPFSILPVDKWVLNVTLLVFLYSIGITEYYIPGLLPHAGSQDTDQSYHVPIFAPIVALCDCDHNPSMLQTNRQMSRSISVTYISC